MNTFYNNFIIIFVSCMIRFSIPNTYAHKYNIPRCIMFVVVNINFYYKMYLNIDKYNIISNITDMHALFLYNISVDIYQVSNYLILYYIMCYILIF